MSFPLLKRELPEVHLRNKPYLLVNLGLAYSLISAGGRGFYSVFVKGTGEISSVQTPKGLICHMNIQTAAKL
jgi:hypothetical protein